MNFAIEQMLDKYNCKTELDYENALKEIIQEIALLGMWRAKFFEVGAFYGGSALRILYGLNRFSEDLDFSLLKPNHNFDISNYESFLKRELESFDFNVEVSKKVKSHASPIESAFVKANTLIHLLKIKPNLKTHPDKIMKIKLEVDTSPPGDFQIDVRPVFTPIPFSVKTFKLSTLFAGKIVATLFRPYKFNIKGRDWFDFLWYISKDVKVDLMHFKARLVQIKQWEAEKPMTIENIKALMIDRINKLNIEDAKSDVLPFLKDSKWISGWSKQLFLQAADRMEGE